MVTSQLAVTMQRRGYRTTAVLDADITGPSIPKAFGLTEKAGGTESALFPWKRNRNPGHPSICCWKTTRIRCSGASYHRQRRHPVLDRCSVGQRGLHVRGHAPGTGDVALSTFQSLPVDGIVIVASPQELVGMVVEKAVRMAEMMDVPILGIVENMSYIVCPRLRQKIALFGESRSEEAAARHGLDLLAEMPIDPKLASPGRRRQN